MLKTIVMVDNDTLFVEQMRQQFIAAEFRVLWAANEAEALRIVEKVRPDVVITEVRLEHQDGGFCLAWQVKKKYPDVPVIIVSSVTWHTGLYFSLSTSGDRAWIKAEAFLDKPIRFEELNAVVKKVLSVPKAA